MLRLYILIMKSKQTFCTHAKSLAIISDNNLRTNILYLLLFRIIAQWHSGYFDMECRYIHCSGYFWMVSAHRQPHRLHGFGSLAHLLHHGVYIHSRYYLASLLDSLR